VHDERLQVSLQNQFTLLRQSCLSSHASRPFQSTDLLGTRQMIVSCRATLDSRPDEAGPRLCDAQPRPNCLHSLQRGSQYAASELPRRRLPISFHAFPQWRAAPTPGRVRLEGKTIGSAAVLACTQRDEVVSSPTMLLSGVLASRIHQVTLLSAVMLPGPHHPEPVGPASPSCVTRKASSCFPPASHRSLRYGRQSIDLRCLYRRSLYSSRHYPVWAEDDGRTSTD
jgi:hypothetical protein